MSTHGVELWAAADLADFATPQDSGGKRLPNAVSWALPMNPRIMANIQQGPNQAYADEYARMNDRLNEVARLLAETINGKGFRAYALAASERTDTVNIKGDFPHKNALSDSDDGAGAAKAFISLCIL
jgi:hypothetical protein